MLAVLAAAARGEAVAVGAATYPQHHAVLQQNTKRGGGMPTFGVLHVLFLFAGASR